MNPFEKAVKWAGGQQIGLAEKLGVSPAAVAKWRRIGIPPERAIQIERLSGGDLRAVDLTVDASAGTPEAA